MKNCERRMANSEKRNPPSSPFAKGGKKGIERTSFSPSAIRYSQYKRIVKLLDGGNALKAPLVRLECGHEIRTTAIRKARCHAC